MLVDSTSVILLRADLVRKLKEQLINTAPNITFAKQPLTEMKMPSLDDSLLKAPNLAEKRFGMETGISVKALAMTTEDSWSSSEI
ncbi:hypothetical protein AVEN_172373-1 [Araneus ventricosus]|uniref:Uncharacterized protein n=1 Tax=Araneus ventricosus TaxID=182803 RepID=A0A4Y2U731_ARAVE|nr:hypothetical protein AVEN_217501-1 [Araneus ventricosus]GBO07844.1 hypothetical protein AVEN_172373-1 [Araneus ventricosus]